jgi:two-component system sensor histidine kinase/response regulator
VAALRITQIEGWLASRIGLLRLTGSSRALADLFTAWRDRQDVDALRTLLARLEDIRDTAQGDAVWLLDTDGQAVVLPGHPVPTVSPELLRVARSAISNGDLQHTGIYRPDADRPPVRLDLVVPMAVPGQRPVAAVVMQHDPRRSLFPQLERWPVPSQTGDTVLWRLQGDRVQAQSDLREQPDAAGRASYPLAAPGLPAAQVLRGEHAVEQVIDGIDYRDRPVTATARRVRDTDWMLVVKLDRAEIDAPALRIAGWIAGLATALLAAIVAGARALSRSQALERATLEQRRQAQQLAALQLLRAIADNSSDAIFAKDLQGRYRFYNRAAAAEVGRPADEVIGLDDQALFPPSWHWNCATTTPRC